MKAYLIRRWDKAGYDLYLYSDYQNARVPIYIEEGKFLHAPKEVYTVGEELPVTLFIPDEVYEPIRKAMVGEAIDNDDALADTRRIRDRLLTMIESEWQSRQLEKH